MLRRYHEDLLPKFLCGPVLVVSIVGVYQPDESDVLDTKKVESEMDLRTLDAILSEPVVWRGVAPDILALAEDVGGGEYLGVVCFRHDGRAILAGCTRRKLMNNRGSLSSSRFGMIR